MIKKSKKTAVKTYCKKRKLDNLIENQQNNFESFKIDSDDDISESHLSTKSDISENSVNSGKSESSWDLCPAKSKRRRINFLNYLDENLSLKNLLVGNQNSLK